MMACEYQCGAEHDGAPRSARRGAPACTGRSGCSPAAGGTGCSRRARCWRRPGRCAPGRGAAPRARAAPPTRPPGAAAAGAARLRAAPRARRGAASARACFPAPAAWRHAGCPRATGTQCAPGNHPSQCHARCSKSRRRDTLQRQSPSPPSTQHACPHTLVQSAAGLARATQGERTRREVGIIGDAENVQRIVSGGLGGAERQLHRVRHAHAVVVVRARCGPLRVKACHQLTQHAEAQRGPLAAHRPARCGPPARRRARAAPAAGFA